MDLQSFVLVISHFTCLDWAHSLILCLGCRLNVFIRQSSFGGVVTLIHVIMKLLKAFGKCMKDSVAGEMDTCK